MRVVVPASVTLIVLFGTVANYGQTAAVFPYDTVTITLPKGEAPAGRQAFVDLKCYLCHRVEGERGFRAGERGPGNGSRRDAAASPCVGGRCGDHRAVAFCQCENESRGAEDAGDAFLSPMGDFSRSLSVRQLADLLAYLGSVHARLP